MMKLLIEWHLLLNFPHRSPQSFPASSPQWDDGENERDRYEQEPIGDVDPAHDCPNEDGLRGPVIVVDEPIDGPQSDGNDVDADAAEEQD